MEAKSTLNEKAQAGWMMITMDIVSNELFNKDYSELMPTQQQTVWIEILNNENYNVNLD